MFKVNNKDTRTTPQNSQIHSNNSSAVANELFEYFVASFNILFILRLTAFAVVYIETSYTICPVFEFLHLSHLGYRFTKNFLQYISRI